MLISKSMPLGRLDQSKIKNNMYLTLAEIKVASGVDGEVCTCIETETMYRYLRLGSAYIPDDMYYLTTGDGGNTRWICLSGKYTLESGLIKFIKRCVLTISGIITADTTILTNNSGVNITKTEDSVSLGSSASEFNGNQVIVLQNGVILKNGLDVIYVSEYSFRLPEIVLDSGDKIVVLK
jgi:hypothetical protein